jgi:hypothetical protein
MPARMATAAIPPPIFTLLLQFFTNDLPPCGGGCDRAKDAARRRGTDCIARTT